MEEALVKLPKKFFDDHRDRELPTPKVIKETSRHYFVSASDEELVELGDDAVFYTNPHSEFWKELPGLYKSAKATLRALGR